jgi:phosphatidylserine/phosphatidylglycerophosphate/cardiolipin synthase-like enzyme
MLARDIADLARSTKLDPFAPDALSQLESDPGLAAVLRSAGPEDTDARGVLLALQVARLCKAGQPRAEPAEFVATVPPGYQTQARPTQVVLREMLTSARRQVIALGDEITDRICIELLRDASRICPETFILCDREKGSARRLASTWPGGGFTPRFYENLEVAGPPLASMHCKAILVDGLDLLITSANFTFHGMNGNLEFGIRLRGAQARPAQGILIQLLRSGRFREVQV